MKVDFVRPDVANLVFHLYGRSVHPELFDVFAEREICHDLYRVHVKICDAGHLVGFSVGDHAVAEVTTTCEHPLPQRRKCLEKRLRGSRDASFEFNWGLRYQVSYQVEVLDPEVFLNFHDEMMVDCHRAEVAQRFPTSNRLAPCPISLIRTDACHDSFLVHSFHTFPESCAVVKTQSLYEL